MPKMKFALSKKHEYLLDIICKIPTIDEIQHPAWSLSAMEGKYDDNRYNTEDAILMCIEKLTKGTQMEDAGKELSEKARGIFDYYSDLGK